MPYLMPLEEVLVEEELPEEEEELPEEVLPEAEEVPFRAAALTATPVEAPPLKNLGVLEEALFS